MIRAEEKTVQLGALIINCVKSDPSLPAPSAEVTVDISVTLDVPVTNNKNFGQGGSIIDAVAVINGADCEVPSPTGGRSACENLHQDPQYGRLLSDGRTIVWESMLLPFPGEQNSWASALTNPAVTTIRIFSVRVNASVLGIPLPPVGTNSIYAAFTAGPPSLIDLSESHVLVGV